MADSIQRLGFADTVKFTVAQQMSLDHYLALPAVLNVGSCPPDDTI